VLSSGEEIQATDIHMQSAAEAANFFNETYTLDDYNRKIIKHYLEKNDENVHAVAQQLNIGKSTIYRMMKEWNEK